MLTPKLDTMRPLLQLLLGITLLMCNPAFSGAPSHSNLADSKVTPKIYPSPTDSWVKLELQSEEEMDQVILIKNISGKTMILKLVEIRQGNNLVEFDLKELNNGLYYITNEQGELYGKVVKN